MDCSTVHSYMAPLQGRWYCWNHIVLTSWILGEDSSTLLSTFFFSFNTDIRYWSLHNVIAACKVKITLRKNCFSVQYVYIILHICKFYTSCFSQDDDVSNLQVPFNVCPFLSFLKWLQDFFLPVTPEFVGLTSIFFSCINQVSKVLLEVVKLSLIS